MSRVQLALNVPDVDRAVTFYSKLFAIEPAKMRPGYANFAIADPPLKLILIEDPSRVPGSLNHLGVEVETPAEVMAATARLAAEGLVTALEDEGTCCYAVQDKVWVDGPGGQPWEIYTVLADANADGVEAHGTGVSGIGCCSARPDLAGHAPVLRSC
jgi:catechol 2,3-dioxygenase-like lactoylglutathione lyase family enzyme